MELLQFEGMRKSEWYEGMAQDSAQNGLVLMAEYFVKMAKQEIGRENLDSNAAKASEECLENIMRLARKNGAGGYLKYARRWAAEKNRERVLYFVEKAQGCADEFGINISNRVKELTDMLDD